MILAAGVLVLLGLGLFVAGIVTDATVLYWLCVGACVVAGILLVVARLRIGRTAGPRAPTSAQAAASPSTTATPPAGAAPATRESSATGATAASVAGAPTEPAPPAVPDAEVPGPPSSAANAPRRTGPVGESPAGDPPVEEVEVTDLLMVVDLHDEVLVVDEHPRYHLAGCPWLAGRTTIPLPIDEARTDGFTPCARCSPDRTLAERERGRRAP